MKKKIINFLKTKGPVSGAEIARNFKISRQAINLHLKVLVESGIILKLGKTRGAKYSLSGNLSQFSLKHVKLFELKDLEEDKVFDEISLILNLRYLLSKNGYDIFYYAFTEALNNAIEHSESEKCKIEVMVNPYNIEFIIRDYGIGIFSSVAGKLNLPDEISAVGELIKGKTTTMPDRHTGEGVFFTSKSGDIVHYRSHKICLIFDNSKKDVFMEQKKRIGGTEVYFSIKRKTRRELGKIFNRYAPEDHEYKFEKTKVFIKLFQKEYVSRSEAKRLLTNLDKFKEITLDFKGVKMIGQGFADEVFRVFKNKHPDIVLKVENLNPILEPVIKHVS